jgi:hypothetical protein
MAIDYVWSVKNIRLADTDSYKDIAQVVEWEVTGLEGTCEVKLAGSTPLAFPSGEFTPYEDLTEDLVLSWVNANLSEAYKNEIEGYISSSLKTLVAEAKPLPWLKPKKAAKKTKVVIEETP